MAEAEGEGEEGEEGDEGDTEGEGGEGGVGGVRRAWREATLSGETGWGLVKGVWTGGIGRVGIGQNPLSC